MEQQPMTIQDFEAKTASLIGATATVDCIAQLRGKWFVIMDVDLDGDVPERRTLLELENAFEKVLITLPQEQPFAHMCLDDLLTNEEVQQCPAFPAVLPVLYRPRDCHASPANLRELGDWKAGAVKQVLVLE